MQRGVRLRARGDGELGVLRQHDPPVGAGPGRRAARGRRRRADPRRAAAVHLEAGVADPGRLSRRPGDRRPHRGRPQPGGPAQSQGTRLDPMTADTILTPELTARWDEPDSFTLAAYRRDGGNQGLPKGPAMPPEDVIATLKEPVPRGPVGHGFTTPRYARCLPPGAD